MEETVPPLTKEDYWLDVCQHPSRRDCSVVVGHSPTVVRDPTELCGGDADVREPLPGPWMLSFWCLEAGVVVLAAELLPAQPE